MSSFSQFKDLDLSLHGTDLDSIILSHILY